MSASNPDTVKLANYLDILENAPPTEKVFEWLEKITDEDFELILYLQTVFTENISNIPLSNQTIRFMRQLNSYERSKVYPELKSNDELPYTLLNFILETPTDQLIHDAFLLLAELLDESLYEKFLIGNFVEKLFDSLDYIEDERVCHAIVKFLVGIYWEPEKRVRNCCKNHPNSRYFEEILLHVLNRSDGTLQKKCLRCIKDILDDEEICEEFFYTNDLKTLEDILVENLENLSDKNEKILVLEVILSSLKHEEFNGTKHRFEEIGDIAESMENSEFEEIREIAIQVKKKMRGE